MKLDGLLHALGVPVQSAEEEIFELFAQELPSQNLGFIDSKAATIELAISGRDLTIHQSPSVLSSNRAGGTTGAVVWKITPLLAEWFGSPDNLLFTHGVLSRSSLVLELGCGISGLVALLLAPRISRYILTDQAYVARLVEQNVAENQRVAFASLSPSHPASRSASVSASTKAKAGRSSKSRATATTTPKTRGQALNISQGRDRDRHGNGTGTPPRIHFTPLDWETDGVTPALAGSSSPGDSRSFDTILACDCIYNEALIEPFVSTCVDLCRLRAAEEEPGPGPGPGEEGAQPTVCVIAQQLRDPLVFEAWLTRFQRSFHTWRVPDEALVGGLRSNSGFVVHVGVLKGDIRLEAV